METKPTREAEAEERLTIVEVGEICFTLNEVERAEEDRKRLETFHQTEGDLEATLDGLLDRCSSTDQLRALRRHLESSRKRAEERLKGLLESCRSVRA